MIAEKKTTGEPLIVLQNVTRVTMLCTDNFLTKEVIKKTPIVVCVIYLFADHGALTGCRN